MPFLAGLILLAISGGVEVVDGDYQIPAADWRYVPLGQVHRPVIVKATFSVESGPPVRLMVLTRGDLDRIGERGPYPPERALASHRGSFEQLLMPPAEYAVAVDNRGNSRPAGIHLQVFLDYSGAERRLAVIAISFAVFFGLVGFSAIKLWRAANPRA